MAAGGAGPLLVALLGVALVSSLAACHLAPGAGAGASGGATPTAMTGLTPLSVYVSASNGQVVALDAATGLLRWSVKTTGQPERPLYVDGAIYVASTLVSGSSYISALRASDGKQLWRHKLGDFVFNPNTDEALAYASGAIFLSDRANIYALRVSDGSQLWKATLPADTSPVAVGGGLVYTLLWSDGAGEQLVALDVHTGALRWQSGTLKGGGNAPRAPVVGDGLVCVETGGALYVFGASDGAFRWTIGESGGGVSPALVGNTLIDANGGLSAFKATTGEALWGYAGSTVEPNQSVVADVAGVYVSFPDGYTGYDVATGKQTWTVQSFHPEYVSPLTLVGSTLYASETSLVIAFQTADGVKVWEAFLPDGAQSYYTPAVG